MRPLEVISVLVILPLGACTHRVPLDDRAIVSPQDVIPCFQQVSPVLYRGGRPKEAGIRQLRRIGIKTIVSLESEWLNRQPGELDKERQSVKAAGMQHYWMPIHPVSGPTLRELDAVLAVIAASNDQPVFVHCDHGNDRTGIVIAAWRVRIQGWSFDEAYAEMMRAGFHEWWLGSWRSTLRDLALGQQIVVTGTQTLLSEDLKSQIQLGEEEGRE